jgi:hypothetical protein
LVYAVDERQEAKDDHQSPTGPPVVKPRLSPELRGFGSPSTALKVGRRSRRPRAVIPALRRVRPSSPNR